MVEARLVIQQSFHCHRCQRSCGSRPSYFQRNIQERYLLPQELCKQKRRIANQDPRHTRRQQKEFRRCQEPNLSSKQRARQIRYDQWFNGFRQELFEHTRYFRTGDAWGLRHVLGKCFPNTHKSLLPDSSSFSKGLPSSSVTTPRQSTVFWYARHVVQFCIWLVHCLSLFVSKGDSISRLDVPQDFHE